MTINLFYIILIIITCIAVPIYAQSEKPVNSCLACHAELDDALGKPAKLIKDDVHQEMGVSCANCHGGDPASDDPEIAMSPQNGFLGAPDPLKIPQFCGRCHNDPSYMRNYNPALPTDQLDKYWTSHHGQLNKKGDIKAAECVSCHSVHDIKRANDPRSTVYFANVPATCSHCHADSAYMAGYHIPINQHTEFAESVHGIAVLQKKDSGAPACNDCHGNHAAMPPGVASIGRVCFQCHPAEAELFLASVHKDAYENLGVAECVFCHNNHKILPPQDEWFDIKNAGAICLKCHSEGDGGYNGALAMHNAVDSLQRKYDEAHSFLQTAEERGVEVSEEEFQLIEVRNSLVNIRKLLHSFNPDTVKTVSAAAFAQADSVHKAGIAALDEVKNRRTGLFIFTIITIIAVTALVLKIRAKEETSNK